MTGANQNGRRPLRIAMVVPPYFDVPPAAYGGIESVVADLADALVDRGHEVVLFGAGTQGTKAPLVPVWERTIPERLGDVYPEVIHALMSRSAVLKRAREEGLDVVHDHTTSGPLNGAIYAAAGLPTVVTAHGPINDDAYRFYSALGSDISLVAISERQRQHAPDLNWIATVHNGLRVDTWPFEREKKDYALFLGRFHPDKGAHHALNAAHAAGLPLVLAGKVHELAEKEYVTKVVEPLLGPDDTMFGMADAAAKRKLLAGARCLLFPVCWEEPFGMVMVEAMAAGTPVVALRGGAVAEVVDDGVTGIICECPEELPDAIARARDIDPAACRNHVAVNFGPERLAVGYERAYHAAINGAPVRPAMATTLRSQYAGLDRRVSRVSQRRLRPLVAAADRNAVGWPEVTAKLPVQLAAPSVDRRAAAQ